MAYIVLRPDLKVPAAKNGITLYTIQQDRFYQSLSNGFEIMIFVVPCISLQFKVVRQHTQLVHIKPSVLCTVICTYLRPDKDNVFTLDTSTILDTQTAAWGFSIQ